MTQHIQLDKSAKTRARLTCVKSNCSQLEIIEEVCVSNWHFEWQGKLLSDLGKSLEIAPWKIRVGVWLDCFVESLRLRCAKHHVVFQLRGGVDVIVGRYHRTQMGVFLAHLFLQITAWLPNQVFQTAQEIRKAAKNHLVGILGIAQLLFEGPEVVLSGPESLSHKAGDQGHALLGRY